MQLKKHVHAELIKEYARQLADGEIDAGWWKLECRDKGATNWNWIIAPAWLSGVEYRFTKSKNHPDFELFIRPGDSFEIVRDRKTIVTMHLAGNLYKVCFTDQTGRYFTGVFDIEEFGAGVETKVPMSVIEDWLNEKIIKETVVRCNRDYNSSIS